MPTTVMEPIALTPLPTNVKVLSHLTAKSRVAFPTAVLGAGAVVLAVAN
ncbi:hypothetical protein ACN083_06175 [Rothia sp. CCM 9418]|nr:hypothetical protein CCASP_00925 [Corynebacterium caspium DSM 44850]